jgi:hypothetical protein
MDVWRLCEVGDVLGDVLISDVLTGWAKFKAQRCTETGAGDGRSLPSDATGGDQPCRPRARLSCACHSAPRERGRSANFCNRTAAHLSC